MSELDNLKQLAEKQKNEKAKISGRLESLYEDLGEEGYNSLEDAEKDMAIVSEKINKKKKTFKMKLDQFKRKNVRQIQRNNQR